MSPELDTDTSRHHLTLPAGGKANYSSLQRHSSSNIDYDNVENCQPVTTNGNSELTRPGRSRTLGDGLGEPKIIIFLAAG